MYSQWQAGLKPRVLKIRIGAHRMRPAADSHTRPGNPTYAQGGWEGSAPPLAPKAEGADEAGEAMRGDAGRGEGSWEGGPCLASLGVKRTLQVGEGGGVGSPAPTQPPRPPSPPLLRPQAPGLARADRVGQGSPGRPGAARRACRALQGAGGAARAEGARWCAGRHGRAGGRGAPGRWNGTVVGGSTYHFLPSPLPPSPFHAHQPGMAVVCFTHGDRCHEAMQLVWGAPARHSRRPRHARLSGGDRAHLS